MALGKYTRVDNRRSSSSYCSTVTIVVFVALCLVGVWMMTSSSVVPVQNVDVPQENKNEVKEQEKGAQGKEQVVSETSEKNTPQFEDNSGDLPEDATKGDSSVGSAQGEDKQEQKPVENPEEKTEEKIEEQQQQEKKTEEKIEEKLEEKPEEKPEDGSKSETENGGNATEDGDSNTQNGDSNSEAGNNDEKSNPGENENKSDDGEKKLDNSEGNGEKTDGQIEEKVDQNDDKKEFDEGSAEKKEDVQPKNQSPNEVFPSGAQSELLNETATQNGSWSTQATESKNEKETQRASKQQAVYSWKLCNSTAGPDFIPCLDNLQAIKSLRSTKHYEHRERHCPEDGPTCLVPLPEGYKRPIEWPKSREKVCPTTVQGHFMPLFFFFFSFLHINIP